MSGPHCISHPSLEDEQIRWWKREMLKKIGAWKPRELVIFGVIYKSALSSVVYLT